ncbi:transcription initiation factor TFIID subunit 6, partial [Tremellales sp. Uapishka_1]
MPPTHVMGVYPSDSVTDVAQGLPVDSLGTGAADLLAGDVEYRLHLIVQEAKKFMTHAKRGTMTPEDVEYALEALNVENVYTPPKPLPQQPFVVATIPTMVGNSVVQQQVYHVPDDEIDFATYLKQPLPAGLASSAGVKWKAHWLAVEGVQPAIPENPAPSTKAGPSRLPPVPPTGAASLRPQAKAHLPQELQLYFTRLTTALIPPISSLPYLPGNPSSAAETYILPEAERQRLAALASLRGDSGIDALLKYIIKWVVEGIEKCLVGPTGTIGCLIDVIETLLDNETLFLEPYLHQLLPPLLSIIVTVPLGPWPPSSSSSSANQPSQYDLRIRAADVLKKLVVSYGGSYPGLIPRLESTLLKTLWSPPFPSPLGATNPPVGRYEGSILGLAALGPHVVRSAVFGQSGESVKRIDELASRLYGESKKGKNGIIKATVVGIATVFSCPVPVLTNVSQRALNTITRSKPTTPDFVPPLTSSDSLVTSFGPLIAKNLEKKPWMASELMRLKTEDEREEGMARAEMASL